jgi:hypothetical protein
VPDPAAHAPASPTTTPDPEPAEPESAHHRTADDDRTADEDRTADNDRTAEDDRTAEGDQIADDDGDPAARPGADEHASGHRAG